MGHHFVQSCSFDVSVLKGLLSYRQAFQFVWDMQADQPTQSQDPPTVPSQNIFAKLFSRPAEEPFRPPVTDMRALNGLESILTKAGVFSK